MTDDGQGRRPGRIKLRLAITTLVVILVLLIVPPYISVSRYRNRITQLISASLGRPVRLSSVELRMLPRPSFVLTDLVVEEDPAYGAEPVLHASTVTAAIRLFSLWRGRLQIDRISVDEASVNLVHTGSGRWNLDSLFRTAAGRSGTSAGRAGPFPYLEASNTRINIKNGVEKLPYSLVSADLSFWREDSGNWRVRLRGQPARTDVSLDLADTGIVRLEATLRRAPELNIMPIHVDIDWREAQLGQLSRLMIGSDEGWRGDLTGEMHVDGTAESAQINARLRAAGVHRAEFAPASPMDFDATCSLIYHYSTRGMENLLCDTPVGEGRARLTGTVPGEGKEPRLTVELDRIPAQVGLDSLRTVRNGIDPGLEAAGAVSGRLDYAPAEAASPTTSSAANGATAPAGRRNPRARIRPMEAGPLTGSLSIAGLRLSGGKLTRPLQFGRVSVDAQPGRPTALLASLAMPAGGPSPLTASVRLALSGFSADVHGSASFVDLRELSSLIGVDTAGFESLSGPPAGVDLHAEGPWVLEPGSQPLLANPGGNAPAWGGPPLLPPVPSDQMNATLVLHNATWKPSFLAGPVEIVSAILHADPNGLHWDPVAFAFGPVQGTGSLSVFSRCALAEGCPPQFTAQFESLDVSELQAAILGARQKGSLLSSLMERFRPSAAINWPSLAGSVQAGSFVLGPVILTKASATVKVASSGTTIDHFSGQMLGGQVTGNGSMTMGEKPAYEFEGQFEKLQATAVGQLLGMTWSGDTLSGTGKVELSGFTDRDLAASAKGTLHFVWEHGAVIAGGDSDLPLPLARFDRWIADAEVANNALVLKQNELVRGGRKVSIEASAQFGDPPQVIFGPAPAERHTER
jgi:hypothetical protein